MIYCDSCARILDDDVQFCPHCNEEDLNWQETQNWENDTLPLNNPFRGEVFDRLREINKHIAKNPRPEPKQPIYEEKPGPLLYVVMIMLATCFSLIGLILGIVYATKRNKNYQALGIVTIVISVIFLMFNLVLAVAYFLVGVL